MAYSLHGKFLCALFILKPETSCSISDTYFVDYPHGISLVGLIIAISNWLYPFFHYKRGLPSGPRDHNPVHHDM